MSETPAEENAQDQDWMQDFDDAEVTAGSEPAWEAELDLGDDEDLVQGEIIAEQDLDIATLTAPSRSLDLTGTEPLDEAQAKELTEHIRSTSNVLYVLIERAHTGKAHLALGYKTFEEYVKEEFDLSRSRAYQLLNQSKFIAEIEAAVPEGTEVRISEAAVRDLKHALDDLVPEIRERTADLDPDTAGEVLEEMVKNYREEKLRAKEEAEDDLDDDENDDEPAYTGNGDGSYRPDEEEIDIDDDDMDEILAFDDDPEEVRKNYKLVYELYASLQAISSLSTASDVQKLIDIIPPERRFQIDENLPKALDWMSNFSELWNSQPWKQSENVDADIDGIEVDGNEVSEEFAGLDNFDDLDSEDN